MYLATLAPGVTLWDAGELIAAIHTLGIPHPPGTPLFVLLGHVWSSLVGALAGADPAEASNLLSAACTAAACGILASLVTRWTNSAVVGLAAALCAGAGSSVWMNATETEAYAASLLHSAAMLWCADRRAREQGDASSGGGTRWTVLLAYLFALAPALHLSALVAAPAAILRAVWRDETGRDRVRRAEVLVLLAALFLAAGAGNGSRVAVGGGVLLLLVAITAPSVAGSGARRLAPRVALVTFVGVSALAVMYVRARFDPAINQGNPATLEALLDAVWRRQYEAVPLWPRRAPLLLQLGNVFEYADWQWALGLAGGVVPSWRRTPITLLYALLGALGASAHRRADRASWRVLAVLLASGSVGVALYLNLRAGPSYGVGLLPDDAQHEARERDYFFAVAFWTWGAWAGIGAVAVARRFGRGPFGLLLAALPLALNWRATDRSVEPEASLARTLALGFLLSAPPRAVLFTNGDNDSYPLWYLQTVEGVRPDVVAVTVPLLGAPWYRAELARRWGLIAPEAIAPWRGEAAAMRAVVAGARAQRRPVAVTVAMPARVREGVWDAHRWVSRGMVLVARAPSPAWRALRSPEDSAAAVPVAALVAPLLAPPPRPSPDAAPRLMWELLRCASWRPGAVTLRVPPEEAPPLLDSLCNLR